MDVDQLNTVLLLGAVILLAAVVAVRFSYRVSLPTLLIYLGLGLLLGEDVIGIPFSNAQLAQTLGFFALVLILAEGGLTTSWPHVRPAMPVAVALATVGVAVSISLVGVAAHFLLDAPWRLAFLIGAVLAPTDAAAVFSVLRNLGLPPRLAGTLEGESGCNDAPVVIVVVLLSTTPELAHPAQGAVGWFAHGSPAWVVGLVVYELAVGAVIGGMVGFLGSHLLRRLSLPVSSLYPLTVMALTVGAYGAAAMAHASGFLSVYVAALVLGNSRLPYLAASRGFAEGLAWLAQIGLFIMLGLLADPSQLTPQILPALLLGSVLLLVARPVSVLVSAAPLRIPWREQAFLSWAGLRGAVPIVFATVPLTTGMEGSARLFDLVFVLVVVFTLLQAPTLPAVARLLKLTSTPPPRDVDVESAPLEELGADLLQLRIPEDSLLHGVEIFELRLPPGATVTLLVRAGERVVPAPSTVLQHGDELLVVATREARDATERRLRAVSRRGKLASWLGESGQ